MKQNTRELFTYITISLILVCGGLYAAAIWKRGSAEGFAAPTLSQRHDAEAERDPSATPEIAAYTLLTTVMKPIRRLGGTLTDMTLWKDRIAMSRMSPVELARKQLQGKQ